MSSDNKNKAGGGSNSWSRPLSKGEGGSRFPKRGEGGGSSGGSGSRPPPGMEGGRSNSNSNKDFVGGEPSSSSSRRTSSSGSGGWGNSNNRSASSNSNGYARKTAGTAAAASTSTNSSSPANDVLRDRFLHLMLSMVGQTVTVTTTTGQVLEGIFHTFSPFEVNKGLVNNDMQNIYCFKAVRVIKKGNDESDSSFKNGSTVLIPTYKVANVQVKSMRLDVVNANEAAAATVASPTNNTEDAAFQTDSQISGGRGGNQNLVAAGSAWTSVGDAGGLGGGLDDDSHARATGATTAGNGKGSDALNWRRAASGSSGARSAPSSGGLPKSSGDMKGSIGDWDQFSANEKKFGVKTNFDENLYTTKLDMKNIDEKRHAEAERIAAEIEGTVSTNIHIATERNQAIAMDYDDEDLYSGVLTKDLKARAVPDNEKKSGKVMNYAAAAQAAAKKGKSDEPTSVDNATEGSGAKDGGARKSQVSDTEALSDLSKVNVSSEEKKVEPENDKAAATDKTTDATKSDTDDNEKDGEAEKKDEKKTETKLKLNPNAKSFSFNPSAKTFTPSFANPPSAPAAPMQPLPPMDGQMMPPHPQEYPGGPPMMGGMGHQYAPMPGEYRFVMFLL